MSNKLFVGNLAWSVKSEKLHEVFSVFGPIVEAKVLTDLRTGRSRGFGFVTFQNEADADRATAEMHNKEIDGRPIRCDNSTPPPKKTPKNTHRRPRTGTHAPNHDKRQRREAPHTDDNHLASMAPLYETYPAQEFMPPSDKSMQRANRRDNRRKDKPQGDDRHW